MAIGDLYELTDRQAYQGSLVVNRYHYRNVTEPGDAEALALGFISEVMTWITPLQSPNLLHTRVDVVNLDDPTDFASQGSQINGNSAEVGIDLPSFVAVTIKLLRTSREIRNGAKRYAGIKAGDIADEEVTAGMLSKMDDLGSALLLDITSALGGDFELVLYGDVTPNRPEPIIVPIGGAVSAVRVTTQNSRKVWVGE